jgi:PAS domain-containing protein
MEFRSLLLEIMILVGAWLCLAVLQKDPNTFGRKTFALATAAWITWCMGELATARAWVTPAAGARLAHIGSLLLAPFWLGLAAQTARLQIARRVPWFPLPLLVPGLCIIALESTARWSGLFLIVGENGATRPGPLWPAMLIYGYTLTLAGCGILIAAAIRWRQPGEGARRIAIGGAPLVTIVGNALYFTGVWQLPADPTPILLGATFVLLHGGIFAGGLMQPLGISQRALLQQLPVGIVLTNRGVVVDINRVAEHRLGVTGTLAIGRNFDAVIDAAGDGIDFEVTPVKSAGAEAGQIVLLDPVVKQPPLANVCAPERDREAVRRG